MREYKDNGQGARPAKQWGKKPNRSDYANGRGKPRQEEDEGRDLIIEGKNAVWEALENGREIDKILFASGSHKSVGHIIAKARELGITAQETDKHKLDKLSDTDAHQGIIAMCAAAAYSTMEDILALAKVRGEVPLIILCDGITDPHNLGAIIRSAEVAGAHGVVIPKRRSAGLNGACAKAAAGALEYVPVAKCGNLQQAIAFLKEHGVFAFAADMGGDSMYGVDMRLPAAIVIGAEGSGISKAVKENCDFVVSIPQKGKIQSLNASNAAAVLLYEALRQRG
ncbi:MAG: 23S rRNA (guanosine(2251)-2'-O)-methyltransferase RlmB [Clostridiaceae bacterium]|nr:23S rRNA (guanosine(2251)-2'-O)-methyltransferase RlmB [Clostridiaceae bacterium]